MQGRLAQIQGIRALAIFGVFITHTAVWLSDDLGAFARISGRFGGAAVATFLMLSGFLLAYKNKLIPTIERKNVIREAWNKASKLYALYLITFIVAFVARTNFPLSLKGWVVTAISATLNLTMTQDFIPFIGIVNAFNGPSWFLSALFGIWIMIYLFPKGVNKLMTLSVDKCVLAIAAIFAIQELWILFAKFCVTPLFQPKYVSWFYEWLVYFNPVMCFSQYCVGVLLGRICIQKQLSVALQNAIAGITLVGVLAYAVMLMTGGLHISVSKIVIAECFAGMGIIAVMSQKSIGYRILSTPMLVWFGNISGYFFLIHGATNFAMHATIAAYIPKPILFFVSLGISILLSACADYYYKNRKKLLLFKNENS